MTTTPAHPDEHFTEIVLQKVRKVPQRRTLSRIEEHLGSLYRRFLHRGELRLSLNGAPLSYEPPLILTAPHWREPSGDPREWRKSVSIDLEGGRRAEGWVAIRARGSTTRAGLALLRRDRVIEGGADDGYRPREVFGSSNSFTYQRLFGELDLINFQVSHTKDGVRWDEAEEEFAEKLRAALSDPELPLLDQAQNWRANESAAPAATRIAAASMAASKAPAASEPRSAGTLRPAAPPRIQRRPLQVASDAQWRKITLDLSDATWEVDLALDYSEASAEWIEVASPARSVDGPRQLQVKLSMHHPFSKRFLSGGDGKLDGVARLATGLAIAEAIAQEDGVRFSSRIRTSLNELLWLGLAD